MIGHKTTGAGLAFIFALSSLLFAPQAALADNECDPVPPAGADPTVNGADPDSYECTAGNSYQATGVTYNSEGHLDVEFVGTASSDLGADGVNLTGNDGDNVTFISPVTIGGAGGIHVTSEQGAIAVEARHVTGGIEASATDGGAVTVDHTSGNADITASSTGGDGNIIVNRVGSGTVSTDTTGGTGDTLINVNGGTIGGTGIEAVTGSGMLEINVTGGGIGTSNAAESPAITTDAGGDATITIADGRQVRGGIANVTLGIPEIWVMDMAAAAGTTTTIHNAGTIIQTTSTVPLFVQRTRAALRGAGDGAFVINNTGEAQLWGLVDFSGSSGGVTLNIDTTGGGGWRSRGDSVFSSGNDLLRTGDDGIIYVSMGSGHRDPELLEHEFGFGNGDDRFEHNGILVVGDGRRTGCATPCEPKSTTLELTDLETFDNAGLILLGSTHSASSAGGTPFRRTFGTTDGEIDDVLSMVGTDYTGLDGAQIALDANLSVGNIQGNCADRNATTFELPVADCVDISQGSTSGTTGIVVAEIFRGDLGAYNPKGSVIVDVTGGDSAQGHFVVSPETPGYSAAFGGVIDKGMMFFPILYDEGNQQHRILGLPAGPAQQTPLLAHAAQSVWRNATGTWLGRQADLRSTLARPEEEGGAWIRLNVESASRDEIQSVSAYGSTFEFDNSYDQDSTALTFGVDLLRGKTADRTYVLGFMAGYTNSDVDFTAAPDSAQFDGFVMGGYASYLQESFYIDAVVAQNELSVDSDVPALDLPADLSTDVSTLGARVESGFRLALGDTLSVEPMASLAYVRSDFDDLYAPADDPSREGLTFVYDSPSSLRGAVGGRLALDGEFADLRTRYTLTAKAINEFDGESRVTLKNNGPDAKLRNDFDGTFTELTLGVDVASRNGGISAFANAGGTFGSDFSSTSVSAGVRAHW